LSRALAASIGLALAAPAAAEPAPAPLDDDERAALDAAIALEAAGETIELTEAPPPPGAKAVVGQAELERAEHDDVHQVLAQVPGVYLREEDGYGLRPNIGMRGAAAERSAKVTLMEDGVLIAPAPYSAPAAYYFPLVTRMARIEVTKGPAAVVHGPATVGGAVDLIGAPMPTRAAGYADVAGGSDRYGKLHLRAADRWAHAGVQAEYVKLRTDGFKELDGGGPTGFAKDDAQLWGRIHGDTTARIYHQLDAKVGYAGEVSDETYTGLTDADLAATPQRRYAGTQLDRMRWRHWRFRLAHTVELGGDLAIVTTAYRHQLHRVWRKLDGFVGERDLGAVLGAPEAGAHAIYYAVVTGRADSSSPEDELLLGTNDRRFVSQGVQSALTARFLAGPTAHRLVAGVRLHHDLADRVRHEDAFAMVDLDLVRSTRARDEVLDAIASTLAGAAFVQDEARWGRVALTAGARVEVIATAYDDHLAAMTTSDRYAVLIPGGGVEVELGGGASALAGVHRGFVPVAPSADADVDPESSVNYELGGRWRHPRLEAEAIGFFSDYSNLKGACTQSTGCDASMDGDEFDGGRVHIWGLEARARATVPAGRPGWDVPLSASYTLTRSAFQHGFASDFAGWGAVDDGDELPYLPRHQLALAAALRTPRGELGVATRWHGASRDLPGQGAIADGERIAPLAVVDLSAHVPVLGWAEAYATCDNLLDEQAIVARRPYGARPNAPRRLTLGIKARF
jgi:Fe(3+) dicitrate transport protein